MPTVSPGELKGGTPTGTSTTEQNRDPTIAVVNGLTIQPLKNWEPDGVNVITLNSTQKLQAIQSILQAMVANRNEASNFSSLPTSLMGATIAWSDENPGNTEISYTITLDGIKVTQNSNSMLASPVATIGTFAMTDAQAVARASEILVISLGKNKDLQHLISNIILPTSGSFGTTISWNSSDTAHIANNGIVNQPPLGSTAASVTLTATITKNAASTSKIFSIIVRQSFIVASDADDVATDKAVLSVGLGSNPDFTHVTTNLTLASSGSHGTSISWGSSNTGTISNSGVIVRPSGSDANLTLTATIMKNAASDTKVFNVTVLQVPVTGVYAAGYYHGDSVDAPAYWVNDSAGKVNLGFVLPTNNRALAITMHESTPLSAGWYNDSSYQQACYWVSTTPVALSSSNALGSQANAIAVDGSDIYIAGSYNPTGSNYACYWKNGIFTGDYSAPGDGELLGIAVSGSDVVVGGYFFVDPVHYPFIWINSTPLQYMVDDGIVSGVAISGSTMYASGYKVVSGVRHPCYWSGPLSATGIGDLTRVDLSEIGTSGGEATGVTASGSDVYVSGYINSGTGFTFACYWKNGVRKTADGTARADSIAVSGSDVYISGWKNDGTTQLACYWKNPTGPGAPSGCRKDLSIYPSEAHSIIVG
jgi:hypothetical protein